MSSITETLTFVAAKDLIDTLMPHNDALWGTEPRDWIFRGQEKASWALTPSAYRTKKMTWWDRGGSRISSADQVLAEAGILKHLLEMSDAQGLSLPMDGPQLRDTLLSVLEPGRSVVPWIPELIWPLAALAQHYGLPTRLLDWSRRPLVGAYFAVCKVALEAGPGASDDVAIWALRRRHEGKDLLQGSGLRLVHAPRALVPNLHLQSGLFTALVPVDGSSAGPADLRSHDAILEAHWEANPPPGGAGAPIKKLILSASEAPRLLQLLAGHFVHAATIYAGYAGAVQAVLERRARGR